MIACIRHTGIVVKDLENSLDFWTEVLEFKLVKKMIEHGPKIDAMMGLKDVKVTTAKLSDKNGNMIELLKFHSHPSKKRWEGTAYSIGITHLALTVSSLDEILNKCSEKGIFLENKPITSADNKVKVVYLECIEGLLLEIVQEL